MTLSVIIVNYNVRRFLENALSSLSRAMAGIDAEVFVVDNASTDGSADFVAESYPAVHLIRSEQNIGFARANNLALSRASGRYVLLINPDTVVQEDTLRVMLEFFDSHPDAGLAGCKILNPDGSFQLPCRRSYPTPWVALTKITGLSALFPRSRLFGQYNLTYRDPDKTYPVDAVSGSFMMISREAYERVGGLDESFFMYGEDLDWCYRVKQAGFIVYYVHSTQIIHFKGESTKRSDVDEIKHFYRAMELFVEKHFRHSRGLALLLRAGIFLRGAAASIGRSAMPLLLAGVDALLVNLGLFLSAALYLGDPLRFPLNAHPVVWIVPAAIVVLTSAAMGLYTTRRSSVLRSAGAVLLGYVFLAAVVFFAKEFAYSRAVVIISVVLSIVLLPGWRLIVRRLDRGSAQHGGRPSLFGRRTLIVGTGQPAREVLQRLRAKIDGGYDVVGFISRRSSDIGTRFGGVEVVGSLDNVGKVIDESGASEVIFSTDQMSYADILSVIARSPRRSINFRLVPDSLEAIIGKTRIDELDTLPLVDIDYNIHRPLNRLLKRAMDLAIAVPLLVAAYGPVRLSGASGRLARMVRMLPAVIRGRMSLVGLPADLPQVAARPPGELNGLTSYLGPRGVTGLVQINMHDDLTAQEIERYMLYYAKNQSPVLDLEILIKSLQRERRS